MDSQYYIINKHIGETPLEALERFRAKKVAAGNIDFKDLPMTYAGRLDPMAEGVLLILVGEECKKKDSYLGLDKEYEVEIIFGIETDTYDVLGLAKEKPINNDLKSIDLNFYNGSYEQEYPAYSSRTVSGTALHQLARIGELPEDMPTKKVEIYSIEKIDKYKISSSELKQLILNKIAKVKGDFRQEEIVESWNNLLNNQDKSFDVMKVRVYCSSGTYMRSLAHRIGKDVGGAACALSIKRTKIYFDQKGEVGQ